MGQIRTTIEMSFDSEEYEVDVTVIYKYYKAVPETSTTPAEPAFAYIEDMYIEHGDKTYPAPWLVDIFCEDEGLLNHCMLDYEEAMEYAAECRAESIREDHILREYEK